MARRPARKRPKNSRRGGCLLCKPWKRVGCAEKGEHVPIKERIARISDKEQMHNF